MKIALTGASGHIGANLCRELLKQGHQLKVLVNKFSNSLKDLEIEWIHGNLLDGGALETLCEDSEVFIHLAASISIEGSQEVLDTNLQGTLNVLKAVRKSNVKRLVHFSSIHAISNEPLEETLDETRSLATRDRILYNRSKALAEQAVKQAASEGLDVVIINPTSVMGPNDFRPSLIGQAIIQLYNGKIPALLPGGYDWVDVRDVVSGTITAMDKGRSGESYLLSGHYLSLKDLYGMMAKLKGSSSSLPIIPFWLARIGVPFLKAWARLRKTRPLYTRESVEILKTAHKDISSTKAEKELSYSARPFKETLLDTITWFRENHYI